MPCVKSRFSAQFAGASTIVIALSLAAGQANAQQTAAAASQSTIEEIVVTGFRTSLEQALNLKRKSDTQVDAILAEDIGKFPDLNLSESIQRIPGVVITRDGGEGRQIAVRGLGPTFTRVRINGLEALSTTGGTDASGGTNRARSFDFNTFASDLFRSITVRKTADAGTEEGSLGATVDLRAARPFDTEGLTAVASAQGSYNDLSKKVSPRGAAMISNTWADGTFGALASAAYTRSQRYDVGTSTVRWATGTAFAPGFESAPAAGPTLAQLNAAFHPRLPRFDLYTAEQERIGLTGSVQWKPTERTLLNVDVLYADFSGTREEQFLESPSFSVGGACTTANRPNTCGIADTNVTAATINSRNTLIAGTFNDVDLRIEDRFDELKTKFTQYSVDGEHAFNDSFKVSGIYGHSESDFNNPVQTTVTLDQFNIQGYAYDYSVGRVPLLSYGSANLTNPASWVLTQIRLRPQTADNTFDTFQGEAEYKIMDAIRLRAGLDLKKYDYTTTEIRRTNGTTTNQEPVLPAAVAAIPLANYTQVITFKGKGLSMPAGSATSWLSPDVAKAVTQMSLYDQTAYNGAFRLGPEPILGNNATVSEKSTGGFGMLSFETALGDIPVRGNAGVRYVKTQQSSTGFTFVSGSPVSITVNREYDDTLPSMNVAVEPTDNFIVRGAFAKVMARPNLGQLSPGATINVSGANRTVTVGNPALDPFRAKTFDVSFEWYPDKGTIVGVALFLKNVGSFVQTLSTTVPFTGNPFLLPDNVATAACGTTAGCSPASSWTFSTPINTSGGKLKGVEINYQQPLRFLPGLLSNTGILLNATYVESKIAYLNAAGAVVDRRALTNLSRYAYNATLYYEDEKFSARVSAAYRSKYLTRVPGQEAGTDVDGTNSTFNVDTSFQYTIDEHFKVSLEGINLTDQFQDQYNDSSNRVSFYHHTGREVLLGVRYTF